MESGTSDGSGEWLTSDGPTALTVVPLEDEGEDVRTYQETQLEPPPHSGV